MYKNIVYLIKARISNFFYQINMEYVKYLFLILIIIWIHKIKRFKFRANNILFIVNINSCLTSLFTKSLVRVLLYWTFGSLASCYIVYNIFLII